MDFPCRKETPSGGTQSECTVREQLPQSLAGTTETMLFHLAAHGKPKSSITWRDGIGPLVGVTGDVFFLLSYSASLTRVRTRHGALGSYAKSYQLDLLFWVCSLVALGNHQTANIQVISSRNRYNN